MHVIMYSIFVAELCIDSEKASQPKKKSGHAESGNLENPECPEFFIS